MLLSKNLDLIIIGGGYWGASIAVHAKEQGWDALVLDSGDRLSGSRNASGICDPKAYGKPLFKKYWPSDWTKEDLLYSLNWLIQIGAKPTREYFWNHFEGTKPRIGVEAIYLDDNVHLMRLAQPRLNLGATSIYVSNKEIIVGTNDAKFVRLRCRRLAIAAGYQSDQVLVQAGFAKLKLTQLFGRGLVVTGKPRLELPMSVMLRPYLKHTIRSWGNNYRIGDTAESTREPSTGRWEKELGLGNLRTIGNLTLKDYREIKIVEGYRPTAERFIVEKLTNNVVVATGGHRVGLGLSGLVGRKVVEMLK